MFRLVVIRDIVIASLFAAAGAGLLAPAADASREPTGKEAKAIKRGFLKPREEGKTMIGKIRVSTKDPDFAAVDYDVKIPEVNVIGESPAASSRAKKTYEAPSPAVLKQKGGKWKSVPEFPSKVKKDLKAKAGGRIDISGETAAVLSVPARCSESPGFYTASVYDKLGDVYLSMQFPSYTGPHTYPALAVRSLAALSVGNMGTVPQWETGQGNDAYSPSGELYVDSGGWGIIEATMAQTGGVYPQSVLVSGFWDCG